VNKPVIIFDHTTPEMRRELWERQKLREAFLQVVEKVRRKR